jgi:predicted amidohydrolase
VQKDNQHWKNIVAVARKHQVFLLGGSVAYKEGDTIVNRSINLAPSGEVIALYDKIHLFSCELGNDTGQRKVINENVIYTPGTTPQIVMAGQLKIGLGICFDLRFPEMWREYAYQGVNTLSISSAFTVPTGKAHWHTLVRARAIENQCFVIAAAQWGRHNDRIQTFGHSLIIDPWGEILADGLEGEKLLTAELNLSKIETVRKSVKVF